MPPTKTPALAGELRVPFEKFELANGLQVVLHEDHTSPVVAVYVCYHVGSAREEPGRSGFAHLFEHMLFQGSQNVEEDGHFRRINEAGGTLNGQTSFDRTIYFETLPANQLELALWLEADRMGFLLPAMTQAKLDNQREVVRNERRQNYENRPYGEASGALHAALFPPGHPYHWIPIGSHEDIEAATLGDVERFFRAWYGPNNATLAIGGDFDPATVRALVEQYFGSLPRGATIPAVPQRAAEVPENHRIELRDRVQLPRLVLAWPAPAQDTADEPAMDLLAMILSENRSSVLDRALMVDETLAREVYISNHAGEVAGRLSITVTAAPQIELAFVEARIHELLAGVGRDGIDPAQLGRMKTRLEARYVRGLETVSGRTRALAESNSSSSDPARFLARLRATSAVTPEQVHAALERYVLDRPHVALSIVPGEKQATVAEVAARPPGTREELAPLPAIVDTFDRSQAPGEAAGEAGAESASASFRPPEVWHRSLTAGVGAWGNPQSGVPLTRVLVALPAGLAHETPATAGLSALTAQWMNEGTRGLSTTQLSDALDALGADLDVISGQDELQVAVTTLDEHRDAALALVHDVLLEPRFSADDFARIVKQQLNAIEARQDSIAAVAEDVWRHLLFGADSAFGQPMGGRRDSIEALTPAVAAEFHAQALARGGARICVVGDLDAEGAARALRPVVAGLAEKPAEPRDEAPPSPSPSGCIHLVDRPGAAQSELRVGYLSVSSLDPDHDPLTVLNYVLGGTFTSRINMNLREDKGYTYGARSGFAGGLRPGPFSASASVHTQYTAESVRELLAELRGIGDGVRPEELEFARHALTQAMLRRYESSAERLQLVNGISRHGRPLDWPRVRLERLTRLRVEDLDALAARHIRPDEMSILVVGDASRVRAGLEGLGLGPVIPLDVHGRPA